MALIIEDGTIVADANSYVTVDEVRAYASERGISTLPTEDTDVEPLVIKAMDQVESFRAKYKGQKRNTAQELQWPRYGVYIDGLSLSSGVIPDELKNGVCQYAIDAVSNDLRPNGAGREVIRKKVGPLETEYNPRGSGTVQTQFNKALDWLKPLFKYTQMTTSRA